MEITSHFFFNLSLITIILFLCLVWSEKRQKLSFSKSTTFIWFAFMLWICFQFSYHPSPLYHFDLRSIPVVIGGLYIGIGPILSLTVIIMRGIFGVDAGFFSSTILYLSLGFLFWRFYPWFWKKSPQKRVCISVCLTAIMGILTVITMEIFVPPSNRLDAWFAYLVIPPLGVGMFAYSIEFVLRTVEMQKNLVKTEKLEAVEQMGAAISHEIRNPLTAAIGFVQLLKEHSLPPKKRSEYLSIVKGELESAERVIQNYLTFSKPSLDIIEEIHVKRELTQVINILKPSANQNSVEISANFAILGSIKGDRQKFHQCFLNIIKNAIESMPKGGHLYIETHYSRTNITIEIKDTGVGMDEEQLQRLGEPYYSTKGSKGTGLGMMVVYSIVKAMQGTIHVDSKIGVGTVFQFTFPTLNHAVNIENQ